MISEATVWPVKRVQSGISQVDVERTVKGHQVIEENIDPKTYKFNADDLVWCKAQPKE